eukprot:TRINITY_DN81268_c0_g1_i1.p1 TRINITY_DN81268_c0_g1~~TRINITY_DN81268_c0_g1_i1.p1  ORF type:complete len:440 (-),score=57.55 TRINITY_DN81268_c0_g1_i1:249-1541(-)
MVALVDGSIGSFWNGGGRFQNSRHGVKHRYRLQAKIVVVISVAVAASSVLFASLRAFAAPGRHSAQRSSLRSLLLLPAGGIVGAGLSLAAPGAAIADGQEEYGYIKIGDNFQVVYETGIGDDFVLKANGKFAINTQNLYNPRVVYVKPGSLAEAQGLRIGDELVYARKQNEPGGSLDYLDETSLRRDPAVDKTIKDYSNKDTRDVQDLTYAGIVLSSTNKVPPGVVLIFKAVGTAQPGDDAPDFSLIASTGGGLSLADLLQGNEYLVLFFCPGVRIGGFVNSFKDELTAWDRGRVSLAALNATVAGIVADPPLTLTTQARSLRLGYPMLSDVDGSVSRRYGASLDMLQGLTSDRKTFVIGKDGKVKATFAAVGFDISRDTMTSHVAEVAGFLGGDPKKVQLAVSPKPASLQDFMKAMESKNVKESNSTSS